jgi:hypothetical protein
LLARVLKREGATDRHRGKDYQQQAGVDAQPDTDDGPGRLAEENVERKASEQHERANLEDVGRLAWG